MVDLRKPHHYKNICTVFEETPEHKLSVARASVRCPFRLRFESRSLSRKLYPTWILMTVVTMMAMMTMTMLIIIRVVIDHDRGGGVDVWGNVR